VGFVALNFFAITLLRGQNVNYNHKDFTKADSVASLYPNHSLSDLRNLSYKLTHPFATDVDKFRAIYRWVCDNIENDYDFYKKNKYKREKLKNRPAELTEWNQKFSPRVFQKLLEQHKTVCTGYAYLVKELATYAGIPCEIINGYGRTIAANIGGSGIANHSWNAVELNNQWYLCDATWSSGSINAQEAIFIRQFSDAYFLAASSLFVKNHYPLDTTWILLKQKPSLQEFLNGPIIYINALSYQVTPIFPKQFNINASKGDTIHFRFQKEGDKLKESMELEIIHAVSTSSMYPAINEESQGLYNIDYVFTRRGTFVVHLLLNTEYLFTYTVNVK